MDVEIVNPPEEIETEEVPVGSVIYEQDLRAAPHRNGWAPDLLGAEVASGDGEGPPDLPDEPGFGPRRGPGQGGNGLTIILACVYLGAGALSLYVGITMLRDLRSGKKKEDQ